jgi:hypothetical protein
MGDDAWELDAGLCDRDSDPDVATGFNNGNVWYYANDGAWTPTLVDALKSAVYQLKLGDVTCDGVADIITGWDW